MEKNMTRRGRYWAYTREKLIQAAKRGIPWRYNIIEVMGYITSKYKWNKWGYLNIHEWDSHQKMRSTGYQPTADGDWTSNERRFNQQEWPRMAIKLNKHFGSFWDILLAPLEHGLPTSSSWAMAAMAVTVLASGSQDFGPMVQMMSAFFSLPRAFECCRGTLGETLMERYCVYIL